MTIDLTDNAPRVSYTVSQGATQTSFTVPFEFFDAVDLKVVVDGTTKTITTHYTVSGGNGSTGTVTMSVTGATGGSTVIIYREIPLSRTTDFPASGAFPISTLNTELDRTVALFDDRKDRIDRSVRLNDNDDDASMVLPFKASRKGTVLGFNATTGAAEAGPTIANVNSLADITTNINTVGGIASNVTTVAGISSNVTTVAGISSNVSTVAGISSNVTTVAGKASLITSDFASDMSLVTSNFVSGMSLVTSDFITDMNLVTSDFVADMSLVTADFVSDLNQIASSDFVSDLNAIEAIKANVTSVAGVASNVTTVAGIASDVSTVASNNSNIQTVSGTIANVNSVGSNIANVNTVATQLTSSSPTFTNTVTASAYTTSGGGIFFIGNTSFRQTGVKNTSGDIELDASTTISLRTNSGEIGLYDDDSYFGKITQDGNGELVISSGSSGGGGAPVTALTFSAANAAFSGDVDVAGTITKTGNLRIDSSGTIFLDADSGNIDFEDGGTTFFRISKPASDTDAELYSVQPDADIVFKGNDSDSSGGTITALTLDMSEAGAANFNSTISATSATFSNSSGSVLLTSSSVAHGMTAILPTATYGQLAAESGTEGGLRITTATEGATAYSVTATSTTPSTDGNGAVFRFRASKKNGTSEQALADTDDLMTIGNVGVEKIVIKGNGDTTFSGKITTASTGITFNDGTTQTTAASGSGGGVTIGKAIAMAIVFG